MPVAELNCLDTPMNGQMPRNLVSTKLFTMAALINSKKYDILSLFLKFPLILSQMPGLSLTISGLRHLRKQVPDIVIHNFTHLFTVEEKSCETIFFRAVSVIFFNSCMNYDFLCRKVLFHSACSGENALRNFR